MDDRWDKDYNTASLTPLQIEEIHTKEAHEVEQARQRRDGIFQVPYLSGGTIRRNFPAWEGSDDINEWGSIIAVWSANKSFYICHECGCFGWKLTYKELFKCYNRHCKSRNITVCRAGEISMAIRNIPGIGVRMTNVFAARKQRLKEERHANRNS